MADPPKPKRPSPGEEAPEPDFAPFEDWLIDGPAGEWPKPWETDKDFSPKQKRIIADNAALLLDREAWHEKVHAFEAVLAALPDESRHKETRARYRIRFDRHVFADGPKDFSNYPFPCSVWFDGAKFGKGDVRFVEATFGDGHVSFKNAAFGDGSVWFSGATFGEGNILFSAANFGAGDVLFNGTVFGKGAVSFNLSTFGAGDVLFLGATFSDHAVSFHGATFGKGDILFKGIKFRSAAMAASGMIVAGNLYVETHFPEAVNFSRLEVKGTSSFSGSSFDKVPDFRDAKFDRPPEVAGMVVPRPKLRGRTQHAVDKNDVAKFRKLKSMALAANDHERDGEFFAGEMLAKRGTETKTLFGLLFNTLYWWLSDFGQSYLRPIGWLAVSYLIFAAACLYKIWPALTLSDRLWFAAEFSFRSLTPLFGSLFRFAPAPEGHVSWYQKAYKSLADAGVDIDGLIALGVAQSVIGTVLLFLLLLALRNKFRLK
ncbi:MAG: pentapeptide repeat-containing protein [Hoeflea sp.]|uniref:pentapeptide repeat-containing protein n=1 Tax=Hoeflea sp. TaxID=1940281 RepID=UPI0032EB5A17